MIDSIAPPATASPQRFQGSSVRAVLADIRAALGRDALILSERREGGRIEMVATAECESPAPQPSAPEAAATPTPSNFAFRVLSPEAAEPPPAKLAPALYRQRLRRLGFTEESLAGLPEPQEGWQTLIRALAGRVRCAGALPTAGIVRFAGPRGAGVTTALLRYACHLVSAGADPRRVTLMHSGDRGLGRDAALLSAGALLGVQTSHGSAAKVAGALAYAHPETLVLLDESSDGSAPLAGALSDDPLTPEQLVFVLPAHWRASAVDEWLRVAARTNDLPPRQCAVTTHTDLSDGSGHWLSLLHKTSLPLAWVQEGVDPSAALAWADSAWLEQRLRVEIDRYRAATTFNSGEPAVEQ